MPQLMNTFESPAVQAALEPEYPARLKRASGLVDGVDTEVTSTSFTDRIMITISQEGRLAQWIEVPLQPSPHSHAPGTNAFPAPASSSQQTSHDDDEPDDLLPLSHLHPRTLLGGASSERETVGQLYATQIASTIMRKNPDEGRTLMIGFGLSAVDASREQFFDLLELVMRVI